MRKPKIIRSKDLEFVNDFEPPLNIYRGVNSKTVEGSKLTMSYVIIPPGGRNQRHYHVNCDAAGYVFKGRLKMFFGPDHEMEEVIVEQGDFFFYPKGFIHGLINLSDTVPVELVATYCGVGTADESGTIFVEPLWDSRQFNCG